MAEVFKIVPYDSQIVDESGADIEAERKLRVMVIPLPYVHSADAVPDSMRYAVDAEPPLSKDEQEALKSKVEDDEDLRASLQINPQEAFGFGFIAVHGGVQIPHLERAINLADYAAGILEVRAARIIFNELVHNKDLEIYQPRDFPDASDYHLEPRHYLLIR